MSCIYLLFISLFYMHCIYTWFHFSLGLKYVYTFDEFIVLQYTLSCSKVILYVAIIIIFFYRCKHSTALETYLHIFQLMSTTETGVESLGKNVLLDNELTGC